MFDMLLLIKSEVGAMDAELVFEGGTRDEAEAARDAYFNAHPDELARFEDNPNLVIALRVKSRTSDLNRPTLRVRLDVHLAELRYWQDSKWVPEEDLKKNQEV